MISVTHTDFFYDLYNDVWSCECSHTIKLTLIDRKMCFFVMFFNYPDEIFFYPIWRGKKKFSFLEITTQLYELGKFFLCHFVGYFIPFLMLPKSLSLISFCDQYTQVKGNCFFLPRMTILNKVQHINIFFKKGLWNISFRKDWINFYDIVTHVIFFFLTN